jgi:hypothetical protein
MTGQAGARSAARGDSGPGGWPLSVLLSRALVAFTIEFDNEAEHRMPHRTSSHGRSGGGAGPVGPWLVSLVMWENCLRYLTSDGITVTDLTRVARTATNLDGMRRWGYIRIDPPPPRKPGPRSVLRPTRAAVTARQLWDPVIGTVEARWEDRFGADAVDGLRTALRAVAARLPDGLPDCLPILGHGLYTRGRGPGDDQFPEVQFPGPGDADPPNAGRPRNPNPPPASTPGGGDPRSASRPQDANPPGASGLGDGDPPGVSGPLEPGLPLSALLSRVLVAFAVEFEREAAVSLAISANLLRVLGDSWTPVRELPAPAGVSKEAVSMATGFLARNGRAEIGPVPAPGRGQQIRLTASGRRARDRYGPLTTTIEERWRARWGDALIGDLRARLEHLARPAAVSPGSPGISGGTSNAGNPDASGGSDGPGSSSADCSRGVPGGSRSPDAHGGPALLMQGLEPYPDGWRAQVRRPEVLPHYPMVLHRGGYPDGS